MALLPFLIVSCDDSEEQQSIQPLGQLKITAANLSDAKSIFVSSVVPQGGRVESDGNAMYKELVSGEIVLVTFSTEEGEELSSEIHAEAIFQLDEQHVLFLYMTPEGNQTGGTPMAAVIHKGNNKVYSLDYNYPWDYKFASNRKIIQKDNQGHCYWRGGPGIVKVNLNNYSYELIGISFNDILVNGEGAIFIDREKILLTTGGYYFPKQDIASNGYVLKGLQNEFLYWAHPMPYSKVRKLVTNGSDVSDEHFANGEFVGSFNSLISNDRTELRTFDHFGMSYYKAGSDSIYSYYWNDDYEAYNIEFGTMGDTQTGGLQALGHDQVVFVAKNKSNQPIFAKSNIPANGETLVIERVLKDGAYEILDFSCGENEEIMFKAIRNADGKTIVARIDAGGTTHILSEESNREFHYMIPL